MKSIGALQVEDQSPDQQLVSVPSTVWARLLEGIKQKEEFILARGSRILQENGFDRHIYYLEEGEVEVVYNAGANVNRIKKIQKGELFGLMAFPNGGFQYASVVALRPSVALRIKCSEVKKLLKSDCELEQIFLNECRREKLEIFLKRSSQFAKIDVGKIETLDCELELLQFKRGEEISPRRNDHFIVLEGQVAIRWEENGREKAVFMAENDFWWQEIYGLQNPSLRAQADGVAVRITSSAMKSLFYGEEAFKRSLQRQVARLKDKIEGVRSDFIESKKMRFLIQSGFTYASAPAVIDLSNCIRCHACEVGCRKRHGISRLDIDKAVKLDIFSFPKACHKCEVPSCIQKCAKGAMLRAEDGEVIIDIEACIGCGACAKSCPFDSIALVIYEEASGWHTEGGAPERAAGKFGSAGSSSLAEEKSGVIGIEKEPKVRKKASKCDHCHGYKDQACVRECPTGALSRKIPLRF